jgi:O-antigen/teichoic acid export membrane protein
MPLSTMDRVEASAEPPRVSPLAPSAPLRAGGLVARNMLALVFSQFVTTPVSIVVNAVLARSLGAPDFGIIYFANTVLLVVFLFVDWGGTQFLAGEVARDRPKAAELLGAAAAQRLVLAGIVLLLIPHVSGFLGYDARVQSVLMLCAGRMAIGSIGFLCSAVFRGFEKLAWHARTTVFGNILEAAILIPTLLLGGRLHAALVAQIVAASITAAVQIALLLRLGVERPRVRPRATLVLLHGGLGFLVLDLVLRLQPYIDATFLSKLARPEAMGWYSAANRIVGALLFPATTLSFAIYPTISRLWAEDRHAYVALVRLALRAVAIVGIFAATGTMLFANIPIDILFGAERFGPAAGNLRILGIYVVLVYASITLGISIAAAKRQFRYAFAQSFCVVVSLVLDPILIPRFERAVGNGGLGVSTSVVVAEMAMVAAGLVILPRGIVDRSLAASVARALAAAAGMAIVGFLLRALPFLAVPLSVATYACILWTSGGLDPEILGLFRDLFRRRRPAAAAQSPSPSWNTEA